MSSETASWPPVSSFPPADADSIPISLPSLTATTNTLEDNGAHTPARKSSVSTVDLDKKIPTAEPNLQSITYQAQKPPLHTSDTTLKHSRAASTSREERISESESNRAGTRAISTDINAGRNQQQLAATSAVQQVERPTGNPRCIVRIDRDHNLGDEATRFECEQFPQEFIDRVTRSQFKGTVEGINKCMEDAEESLLNCLDTLLDCLTAYTAKHCFGTHYQRAMRRMVEFIEQENRNLYHPAKMHLRDPQKVGMIYLEFEIF